jgi:hypothetical protein
MSPRWSLGLGIALFTLPAVVCLLAAGLFALGDSLHAAVVPVSVAVVVAGAAVVARRSGSAQPARELASAAMFAAVIIVGASVAASQFVDLSYDGQFYHQYAIANLAHGWNPFAQIDVGMPWPQHYPKASWIVAAAIYQCTGSIETAKAATLIYMVACFLVVYGVLGALGRCRRGWSVVIAGIVAANPVALGQSMSFYVDGQLAALFAAFAALLVVWLVRGGAVAAIGIAATGLLLINTKFTGLGYAGVLAAAAFAYWLAMQRGRGTGQVLFAAGALLVAVLGVGFNPYVTNALHYGHPLHPVAGPGARDIASAHRPRRIAARDEQVGRLLLSLAARATVGRAAAVELKVPFAVDYDELRVYANADVRTSGHGPLASGTLLLALAGFWAPGPRQVRLRVAALAAVVLLTVLINPEAWRARFVPQLWLLPALALFWQTARRGHRHLALLLAGAALANAALIAGFYFPEQARASRAHRDVLSRIVAAARADRRAVWVPRTWIAPRIRLAEAGAEVMPPARRSPGVPDRRVTEDRPPCGNPKPIPGTHGEVSYCLVPGSGSAAGGRGQPAGPHTPPR